MLYSPKILAELKFDGGPSNITSSSCEIDDIA